MKSYTFVLLSARRALLFESDGGCSGFSRVSPIRKVCVDAVCGGGLNRLQKDREHLSWNECGRHGEVSWRESGNEEVEVKQLVSDRSCLGDGASKKKERKTGLRLGGSIRTPAAVLPPRHVTDCTALLFANALTRGTAYSLGAESRRHSTSGATGGITMKGKNEIRDDQRTALAPDDRWAAHKSTFVVP